MHTRRAVCAGVNGRAICAISLEAWSRQVVRDRCTVSLVFDRRLCMHGVRNVPVCAGVWFAQYRLMGAHVR